jgi:hypothetical protein
MIAYAKSFLKWKQRFSWLLFVLYERGQKATIQNLHLCRLFLLNVAGLPPIDLPTQVHVSGFCLSSDHLPAKSLILPYLASKVISVHNIYLAIILSANSIIMLGNSPFSIMTSSTHICCYKALTSRVILSRLISNPKRFSSFFILRYILIMRLKCRIVLSLPSIFSLTIL